MIKVNLAQATNAKNKKAAAVPAAARVRSSSSSKMPLLLFLMVIGTLAGGYYWYMTLSAQGADLTERIAQADKQLKELEAILKQDQIYEARKIAMQNRIKVIDNLKRNQISPVMSLDFLADAVNRTRYVWLSSLDQNNATFSMNGTGTSVDAIADFVSNLEATGYFRNINLQRAEDSKGNFSFSMNCEFAPPALQQKPAEELGLVKGAN